jgi:hypothetical protein
MLSSGHIKYYMEEHRNLYKYSQQGWESLNSKVKQFFSGILSRVVTMEKKLMNQKGVICFQLLKHFNVSCCRLPVMLIGTLLIYFNN